MDKMHRQIRGSLQSMAPRRAIALVEEMQLPADEARTVIECDVRRRSCVEAARSMNVSPETVKAYRRRAYTKMADELKYGT